MPSTRSAGLPAGGKGLRQDVIQGFAVCQELLEAGGFSLQGFIVHLTVVVLQGQDGIHLGADALELLGAVGAEQFIDESHSLVFSFGE